MFLIGVLDFLKKLNKIKPHDFLDLFRDWNIKLIFPNEKIVLK